MDNASLCPGSIPLFPTIPRAPRPQKGKLGNIQRFHILPFIPSIPYSQFFPFSSVLGYRAPIKENHTLFPAQIPMEFASQKSFGHCLSPLEIQAHLLPWDPVGFRQIPGAVPTLTGISHPSEPGRNFSSRFYGKEPEGIASSSRNSLGAEDPRAWDQTGAGTRTIHGIPPLSILSFPGSGCCGILGILPVAGARINPGLLHGSTFL